MKPTPLLDMWQKPDGAGDPIGVLATTFTLDPDFFERNCLARFLALESANEGTRSAEDLVARLELEEGLRATMITVLADRSARAERSSLRWDLLHCQVNNGLLHSKVAILQWENATRLILGSANLTPAGYRHNIELAMAVDIGPSCLFPNSVLVAVADEIESYLELVPGLNISIPARKQAIRILQIFRERIIDHQAARTKLVVELAPSNEIVRPLDVLPSVWAGPQPLEATHVSPFWDDGQPAVLNAVSKLLTGRPAADRWHRVAVTIGAGGEISFPPNYLKDEHVDEVVQLGPLDANIRPLHAKCLSIQSGHWIAALVGSSNHTTAGLGLGGPRRHRELNVWLGAPLDSREGKALRDLIPCGSSVSADAPYEEPEDEDEADDLAALPSFFQLCRLSKDGETWQLQLSFGKHGAPKRWRVSLPNRDVVIDSDRWLKHEDQIDFTYQIDPEHLPMFLDVAWEENRTTWVVIADNRHELPPGPGLVDIRSAQLLDALASGKSLAQLLREQLVQNVLSLSASEQAGIVTDPLKRFDSYSTLLRSGRALATALSALERRLARPVTTLDALEARLLGPLGPQFIASKIVAEFHEGIQSRPYAIFTLAEIALSLGRVPWNQALQFIDHAEALQRIEDTIDELDNLRAQLGPEPADLVGYATHAIKEAKLCLAS